jgi:regulatory protein YycI of two-component signal transduction system YycFG
MIVLLNVDQKWFWFENESQMTELPLRTYMPFTIVLNTQEAMIFFLLDWRQVLSYDVSLLNIHLVVNSLIDSA